MKNSMTFLRSLDGVKWFVFLLCGWLTLLLCAVLAGCVGAEAPVASVNSYCTAYKRVITTEHEGASLHSALRPVKERIAANDALYRCECEQWNNPICQKVK